MRLNSSMGVLLLNMYEQVGFDDKLQFFFPSTLSVRFFGESKFLIKTKNRLTQPTVYIIKIKR